MKQEKTILTCDVCQKTLEVVKKPTFGPTPEATWFHVSRLGHSGIVVGGNFSPVLYWDVCSIDCLNKLSDVIQTYHSSWAHE